MVGGYNENYKEVKALWEQRSEKIYAEGVITPSSGILKTGNANSSTVYKVRTLKLVLVSVTRILSLGALVELSTPMQLHSPVSPTGRDSKNTEMTFTRR